MSASTVYLQKYKSSADTVKLNKDYVAVSNGIAELTSKLTIAQKDARDADNNVKDQDKKIAKLASQLQKKQERLRELDDMRLAIRKIVGCPLSITLLLYRAVAGWKGGRSAVSEIV
jgi:uncharacterized protein YlxW (UPF0749 family)